MHFLSQESEVKVNRLSDVGGGRPIEESQRNWSDVSSMEVVFETKFESRKQCVDPESMSVMISEFGIRSEVSCSVRELGPERADALSLNSASAPMVSTQSSVGAESRGLLSDFLTPRRFLHRRSFRWRSSCP